MNYSQNNEQEIIERFFAGKTGRFLDIGAYDGLKLSNTRRLLELGWAGVMVEPSPVNFVQLMANTKEFSNRVDLVMAAVKGNDKLSNLTELYIDEHEDRGWAATVNYQLLQRGSIMRRSPSKVWVTTILISDDFFNDILEFDFISLDAEWEDFSILKAMPAGMLERCKLLCVEPRDLSERHEMKKWFSKCGFSVHAETPENLIVKKSIV